MCVNRRIRNYSAILSVYYKYNVPLDVGASLVFDILENHIRQEVAASSTRFLVSVLTPGLLLSAIDIAASERLSCLASSFAVIDMAWLLMFYLPHYNMTI